MAQSSIRLSSMENTRLSGSPRKPELSAQEKREARLEKDIQSANRTLKITPTDVKRALRAFAAVARRRDEYKAEIRQLLKSRESKVAARQAARLLEASSALKARLKNLLDALDMLEDNQRRLTYLLYIDGQMVDDESIQNDWGGYPGDWREDAKNAIQTMADYLNQNKKKI